MKNVKTVTLILMILTLSGCVGSEQKQVSVQPLNDTKELITTVDKTPIEESDIPNNDEVMTTNTSVSSKGIIYAKVRYMGVNNNYNVLKMDMNITTDETGRLTYLENYYSRDSNGEPALYSSSRYIDGYINGSNMNLQILRPKDHYGTSYSLIEMVFVLNGNRTTYWYDYWHN